MTAPLQSREEVVEWIDACVLGDLRIVVQGIDAYYASPQHVTPDGRPTGAAIDYLAHLYTGTGTDEAKATAFVGKFLAPINQRYGEAGRAVEAPGRSLMKGRAGAPESDVKADVGNPHIRLDARAFMARG